MKTKLFDFKYVHEFWDDEIDCRSYFNEQSRKLVEVQAISMSLDDLMQSIEKLAYMGVDITAPTEISKQIPSIKVLYNDDDDDDFQFRKPEGGLNKYVYYDPNLAAKVANINGVDIEYYDDEDKDWYTASQILWDSGMLRWDNGTLYRIKGEDKKPKLQLDSLTIDDAITKDNKQFILDILLKEHDYLYDTLSYAFDRSMLDTVTDQFKDELILRRVIIATAKKHNLKLDSLYTWKFKMDRIQWFNDHR